jgi:hypothetical protein
MILCSEKPKLKGNKMNRKKEIGKKLWQKPELTVLVRNKPEEAVLEGCKTDVEIAGSIVLATGCGNPGGGFCGECTSIATS